MNDYTFKAYYGGNGTIQHLQIVSANDVLQAINKYCDNNFSFNSIVVESMHVSLTANPAKFEEELFPEDLMDDVVRYLKFKLWTPKGSHYNPKRRLCVKVWRSHVS